jgi:hypothetical protein
MVKLDTDEAVRVIERLGFNHDVGARTAWASHAGEEFMIVHLRPGTWRRWKAADRVRPFIEHLAQKRR